MRNLKRALSLALASVMLVGMMVVGTSAASFPDVDDSYNVEAIEVLNAVEVMIGDNGDFRPDDTVTRNEMAVIMAKLILGKDADNYVGTHPFTDVPEWADKYVAACYNEGIVAGREETVYDGQATVTAEEAAAMMLRALGYEKLEKIGQGYPAEIVKRANNISLFKNVGSNPKAPMTRNQIAQLSLNTLKATMVISDIEEGIIIEGVVTMPTKATYEEVESSNGDFNAAIDGTTGAKGNPTVQLGEKLYEGKLTFDESDATDNFGRTASTWRYDDEKVIAVADKADKSYVGAVKTGTIYSDLGLSATIETSAMALCEDGVDGSASYDIAKKGDDKYGADGQTVEVFYDKDGDPKVTIVVINTYLGIVTDDDVREDDKDGVEITLYGEGAAAGEYFYESSLYKKGDTLLVNVGHDAEDDEYVIEAILGEPETVSGSVTRIGKDDDLTISGEKYPQAAQFSGADNDVIKGIATINSTNVSISSDATYTLYLDQNGNYLAVVEDENNSTTTDLVYVFSVTGGTVITGNKAEYSMFATVVRMDGTVETVPVGEKSGDPASINESAVSGAQTTYKVGDLVDLTYDEDEDEYTIATAADYTNTDLSCTDELKAETKFAKLAGGDTNYYLNSKTVYLFVTADEDDDTKVDKVEHYVGGVSFDTTGVSGVFAADGKNADYVVFLDGYTSAEKDIVYISNTGAQGSEENGILFKGYKDGGSKEELVPVYQLYNEGSYGAVNGETEITVGLYEYTLTSKDGMKLKALEEGDGFYAGKAVSSINNSLIDVADVENPCDATNVKVVDLSDVDAEVGDADENAYGRKVTSLSSLKTVVDKKTGDDPTYTVTVDIYVNDDDEVVALFIKSIAAAEAEEPEEHTHNNWSAWSESNGKHVRSCQEDGCDVTEEHNPNMASGWTTSATQHWHACQEDGCTIKTAEGSHAPATGDWEAGATCNTCSFEFGGTPDVQ